MQRKKKTKNDKKKSRGRQRIKRNTPRRRRSGPLDRLYPVRALRVSIVQENRRKRKKTKRGTKKKRKRRGKNRKRKTERKTGKAAGGRARTPDDKRRPRPRHASPGARWSVEARKNGKRKEKITRKKEKKRGGEVGKYEDMKGGRRLGTYPGWYATPSTSTDKSGHEMECWSAPPKDAFSAPPAVPSRLWNRLPRSDYL